MGDEESKKVKARLSTLYEYDYKTGKIDIKNKKCPRCGSIMAHHESPMKRWTCGSCNYTEFIEKGNS